jgi:peroxiredoxin
MNSYLFGALALGISLGASAYAEPVNNKNLDPKTDTPGLSVGEQAPTGVSLMTVENKPVALETLWADGPVVVTFYRGGWCPYCTKELAKWEPKLSEVEALGAEFVAITMEKPDSAQKTSTKHAANMRILSDVEGDVSRAFRLAFALDTKTVSKYKGYGIDLAANNANGEWELPAPGTYVIDETGAIRYAWASWDYTKRAPVDEVMKAVRAVASEQR